MDRLNQIRGEAERSKDFTLDTSSPPSEAYITANESSSKFFSLSEVDSTFSVSPTKDGNAAPANVDRPISDSDLISNLSPIPKTNDLGSFKIGKQIEAANILSGGVNIFDDNSYDGDELVIDDNVPPDDGKSNSTLISEDVTNVVCVDKADNVVEATDVADAIKSKDTEVVLQIDGKNVDAIDIGNDLYLYRKPGEEELAAVQIVTDNEQQPCFKFLKVRENAEGNLEVYEEIEIEVPKEVPITNEEPKESSPKSLVNHDKPLIESDNNKTTENTLKNPQNETESKDVEVETSIQIKEDSKVNFNGKVMKFSESRKSPVISTFTPMTYHSTPNKEGIPLTKTMVDQQLHPNRQSDNIKKTIEVHTECSKHKLSDTPIKNKELIENNENDEKDVLDKTLPDIVHTSEDKPLVIDEKECKADLIDNKIEKKIIKQSVGIENKDSNLSNEITLKAPIVINEDKNFEKTIVSTENNAEDTYKVNKTVEEKSSDLILICNKNSVDLITGDDTETVEDKLVIVENISSPTNTSNEKNSDTSKTKAVEKDQIIVDSEPRQLISDAKIDVRDTYCSNQKNKKQLTDDTNKIKDIQNIGTDLKHTKSSLDKTNVPNIGDNLTLTGVKHKAIEAEKTLADVTTSTEIELNKYNKKVIKLCDSTPTNKQNQEQLNIVEKETIQEDLKLVPNLKITEMLPIKSNESQQQIHNTTDTTVQKIDTALVEDVISLKPIENETKINSNIIQNQVKENKDCSFMDINKHNIIIPTENKTISLPEIKSADDIQKPVKLPVKANTSIVKIDSKIDLLANTQTKQTNKKNCAAVPFGKWTEANRQEFLNKIKETKVASNNSSTKQLKQPKDLNRRDVLKKIDSQRQSNNIVVSKAQDVNSSNKPKVTTVTFKNKPNIEQTDNTQILKDEKKSSTLKTTSTKSDVDLVAKKPTQRKEINNQDLIDKTIEGIINRALPVKATQDEHKQSVESNASEKDKNAYQITLDDIEKKMNELHGIPFVERPPHELPALTQESKSSNADIKTSNSNKPDPLVNLPPFTNKPHQNVIKEHEKANISDEEIIEHIPITGDIKLLCKDTKVNEIVGSTICDSGAKKEPIITEKDFDKFARRNSFTYENLLTVNFDRKEPHNVIKSVVPKDIPVKKLSRNELMLAESKAKSTNKHNAARHNHSSKIPTAKVSNETYNKNYQSKVQIAYQSALTAKRQLEGPITIIEDKPVKVVFMDTNPEFVPVLNMQGQELSPTNIQINESSKFVHSASESLDSDILESYENKLQDDTKSKSKHQRKQVLTPVETPELELIEPGDLGMETSPKKKRRFEDKADKKAKALVPKKSYLLNRNVSEEKQDVVKNSTEIVNKAEPYVHSDPISAIDNLVKAAELLETQSENKILTHATENNSQQNTPVKRGRGRPRKNPLPGVDSNAPKTPSPQKKPRLQEEKSYKEHTETEESSDDEIIKENWTMGKINENIVCPICNKLFRSENVVFKHVKHCTGPSPNRSDSDKRSSSRLRFSQESKRSSTDSKSDIDLDEEILTPRKRKSRDSKPAKDKYDEIINKDLDTEKQSEHLSHKTVNKAKFNTNNLVCELCGKSFRQLSYLLSHKLQHRKEDLKSVHNDEVKKNVFCCEVCKKEFRKLHHLVQHRPIHKPNAMSSRLSRKSSSEHRDNKSEKDNKVQVQTKQTEDHSAGFRCEPCDKSFRKLHHLVEHRETHDGINKKCPPQVTVDSSKSLLHQCDICKKTFKKLQHFMEHKDQHLETSSEKSDDKSVQSSLSTRDIIHECSLCYMVFPNEHSLNKHTIICLRKKKQSAAKAKQTEEKIVSDDDNKEEKEQETDSKINADVMPLDNIKSENTNTHDLPEITKTIHTIHCATSKSEEHDIEIDNSDNKSDDIPLIKAKESETIDNKTVNEFETKPLNTPIIETIVIPDTPTPKKRTATKEKSGTTVTKKQKTLNVTMPVIEENKSARTSNDDDDADEDDDEVRYMLNPHLKLDDTVEEKFMKVRAKKRSSLQLERPNSKDLVIRRISLQHPPKIPRLKAKPVEAKIQTTIKNAKAPTLDTVPSTDSDDSDIKYSFPKTTPVKQTPKKVDKSNRKIIGDKRKSLSSIAKRKSLGKHKQNTPVKKIRKRTAEVEHRCDCGQLFSSAALLSRHTTLAHTPPRIRRRRSPPPDTKLQKPLNLLKTNIKQSQSSVTQAKPQSQQLKQKPTTKQKPSLAKQKLNLIQQKQTSSQQKQTLKQQKNTSNQQKQTLTQQKSNAQSSPTRSKSNNINNAEYGGQCHRGVCPIACEPFLSSKTSR
ncbi:uncharacterized protein LOC119838308 isoform X2 [Zerene cesonia]|uniref:uncharacterized protein LOC119838308 isoform X2 n=1 Tax=Zerene cesonia TaxID=33412 RepID=UPI0018E56F03|nr:uncharacterized protein LOC119838308 isoform X2 [Zerene cesonia]